MSSTTKNRPPHRAGAALLVLLSCVAPLAFSAVAEAGGAEEPEREARGALTSEGSFYVEWIPDPDPIPLNEIFTVRFRVLDPEDHAVLIRDAAITANASMPEHNHGTTLEPRVENPGDGTATARGFLFHMEGKWHLGVGVAVGGRMERATFDILVEP